MCVRVCACVCTWMLKAEVGMCLCHSPASFLRDRLVLSHTYLESLAAWCVPETLLSPPASSWGHSHMTSPLAFSVGSRDPSSGPHPYLASMLLSESQFWS